MATMANDNESNTNGENSKDKISKDEWKPERRPGVVGDPDAALLRVNDLHVEFRMTDGVVSAVNGLTYRLDAGETVAILGESGSGKSVSAQAVMGILDSPPGFITGGTVEYRGVDVLKLSPEQQRKLRANDIAMVFQDALSALNPVFTVGWQIGELFRKHRGMSRKQARKQSIELLDRVRIPGAKERVDGYPHEFSGGMRQRVMIAMGIALDPAVLIADEPTTALDVTVQAQIMDLLADLQSETAMGLLLITHDLGVVAEVADRVVVMYAGREVEAAPIAPLYASPRHPYTSGLMQSIPRHDVKMGRLEPIAGSPPDLMNIPRGCPFHPRCPYVIDRCKTEVPELARLPGDEYRVSACLRVEEIYP
jgi:oligopeptide transport system ATP-binding protein